MTSISAQLSKNAYEYLNKLELHFLPENILKRYPNKLGINHSEVLDIAMQIIQKSVSKRHSFPCSGIEVPTFEDLPPETTVALVSRYLSRIDIETFEKLRPEAAVALAICDLVDFYDLSFSDVLSNLIAPPVAGSNQTISKQTMCAIQRMLLQSIDFQLPTRLSTSSMIPKSCTKVFSISCCAAFAAILTIILAVSR